MAKANMKSALRSSLQRESIDFEEKCRKADSILNMSSDKKKTPSTEETKKPTTQTQDKALQEHDPIVRLSISVLDSDTELILQLRRRLFQMGIDATRSRIIRASIAHLVEASDTQLRAVLEQTHPPSPKRQQA
ncbi:MAG: hypothetical protein AAF471_02370 [Myxococcota bacterium]